ncbi:hypothetical protein [Paludisphaera soli]|uniref:hypothetical protein n=1 Tax=Paludisphaera soli TaxID=2712865 RepID=UPI0013EE0061|nr:hypothetical protein [Paludisphaera soli]
MPKDPLRPLRLRWDDLRDPGAATGRLRRPELDAAPTSGTPRFLGRVRDAGAIPTTSDRVFLVNPARLGGGESEGATAGVAVDSSRSIPVAVVGAIVPKAGDLIQAFAVGGRWVAAMHRSSPIPVCGTCTAPQRDLVVSWTNALLGSGTTPLIYNGADEWTSSCANHLIFRLICRDGTASFRVAYYTAGNCPGGQAATCTSPGQSPLGLSPSLSSCTPFMLQYNLGAGTCPTLASQGYTRFTVTA